MKVVFFDHEEDKKLLVASVKALESDVLAARFQFTVEHDDSTKQTTLWFWHRTGDTDAK